MADRRALVRNAADPQQVRFAARKERQAEEQLLAALRLVLATAEGRHAFGELLEDAGLFESSFDHSGSVMYFKEGRRNFGLKWQARLIAADEQLYELLERDRRRRRQQLERETDAVQTAPAEGGSNG